MAKSISGSIAGGAIGPWVGRPFGAAAPVSKMLLASIAPQILAGLLYLGAGLGLAAVHFARSAIGLSAPEAPPRRHDLPWLGAIVVFGGTSARYC